MWYCAVCALRVFRSEVLELMGFGLGGCRLQPVVMDEPETEVEQERTATPAVPPKDDVYTPYLDDPTRSAPQEEEYRPDEMLQQQRMMMDGMCLHLHFPLAMQLTEHIHVIYLA